MPEQPQSKPKADDPATEDMNESIKSPFFGFFLVKALSRRPSCDVMLASQQSNTMLLSNNVRKW